MVKSYGADATFVVQNYGESELAARHGVKRYPAIFVNDVLVATPKDFGFTAQDEGAEPGRYAPLRKVESHDRFRADLKRVIDLLMAGKRSEAGAMAAPVDSGEVATLPPLSFTDLSGRKVEPRMLAGKVVVVEFWATWCPPCRSTLAWLGDLQTRFGDKVVVLALAVESDEAQVKALAAELKGPLHFAMRTPAMHPRSIRTRKRQFNAVSQGDSQMKIAALILSVMFVTAGQTPAPTPATAKPIDAFQGSWAITSFNGQEIPADAGMFLVFKGDKYEQWTGSTVDERGTIKLDVTKKPMWIDLIITEGSSAGTTQPGLYSIEGDTMNVTLANPGETVRPSALGQGEIVAVLKKAK